MGSEGSTSPVVDGGCAVCGGAAAVYCVADAAELCVPCDATIHAANPLASRHERVTLAVAAANSGLYDLFAADDDGSAASSWLAPAQGSPNYSSSSFTASDSGGENILFDLLSDVDIMASCGGGGGFGLGHMPADGVAPHSAAPLWLQPGLAASANGALTSWSPQPTTAATVLAPAAEREARVRRYREKRKNRRFQKTIRYASRKAYAEARPRIKGRFVKRVASSSDDDSTAAPAAASAFEATDGAEAAKFSLSFSDENRGDGVGFYMGDAAAYGVVPTF